MKSLLKHKLLILLGVLIIGVVVGGNYLLNKGTTTTQSVQQIIETAQKGNITKTVSASGQIESANYLAVTTSVNGIVKKVYVKEGDKIIKGQKLMEITLDSEGELSLTNAYSSYQRARSSVTDAQNTLYSLESAMIQKKEAFEDLKKINSYQTHDERISFKLAENDYIKAKNDYDSQKEKIAQAQTSLSSAWNEYQSQSPIITAASDGLIANIVAVEGTRIENSVSERSVKTVASIKKEGTPITSLNVSELDISSVKVGQKVNVTVTSISDETFTGSVVGIDKIGSVSNGVSNYPVIVKFEKDSPNVLPNMNVDAEIILEEKKDVLLIPSSAITKSKNEATVKTMLNGNIQTVTVKTGISDSNNTEIIEGLKEGDQVIIESLPTQGFTNSNQSTRNVGGLGGFGVIQRR